MISSVLDLRLVKFTDRSRKVMSMARQLAVQLNCDHIGTEHLLLGLVKSEFGRGMCILVKLGVKPSAIEEELAKIMKLGGAQPHGKSPSADSSVKKVIDVAIDEARYLGYNYVGTEHLVVALLRVDGVAAQVLNNLGVTYDKTRELVLQVKDVRELSSEPLENEKRTMGS
jgi:ATP-dependent Clp protease ATP-binding subunit ClpC